MDIQGLQPLFNQQVIVATASGTKFIGVLQPIGESKSTVQLTRLDAATAANYDFAINGVSALDIGNIVFIQRLNSSA